MDFFPYYGIEHRTVGWAMHKKNRVLFPGIIGWLVFSLFFGSGVAAQEESYELAHEDVFGPLQRPSVHFPHDRHMDALDEEGCGICHHVFDKEKGELVPVDDPDAGCTECHGSKKDGSVPALREAFHGSCNVCHRDVNRVGEASPPVACGECHKKKNGAGQER